MSMQWAILIVLVSLNIIAQNKAEQLYGIDVDRLIQQVEGYEDRDGNDSSEGFAEKFPLRGNQQNEQQQQNYFNEFEKAQNYQKSIEANQKVLQQILGYPEYNKRHHVKKSKNGYVNNNSEPELQAITNLLNHINDVAISDDYINLDKATAKEPKILVVNLGDTRLANDLKKIYNTKGINNPVYSQLKHKKPRRQELYKGFVLQDKRRANRETKEESAEADYKPAKRPRDHFGGRTAIPYLKNRGDIYEKDDKF